MYCKKKTIQVIQLQFLIVAKIKNKKIDATTGAIQIDTKFKFIFWLK